VELALAFGEAPVVTFGDAPVVTSFAGGASADWHAPTASNMSATGNFIAGS
jgi:hypothetical protein